MKINNLNIYKTSKEIRLSRTQSTQSGTVEGLSLPHDRRVLTGEGRLGAIISVIQAKKHSHAIQEREGTPRPSQLLVKRSLAGQKKLMLPHPDVCAGFPPLWKAFPGAGSFFYMPHGLLSFLDTNII